MCARLYIYEACRGEIGFKRYTKTSLTEEINKYVFDKDGKRPSTREIIDWRDNCRTNVSIYALDPFYNKFVSSSAPRNNGATVRLCFICKDGHFGNRDTRRKTKSSDKDYCPANNFEEDR